MNDGMGRTRPNRVHVMLGTLFLGVGPRAGIGLGRVFCFPMNLQAGISWYSLMMPWLEYVVLRCVVRQPPKIMLGALCVKPHWNLCEIVCEHLCYTLRYLCHEWFCRDFPYPFWLDKPYMLVCDNMQCVY